MEGCDCIEPFWPTDELLIKYQYISDFFIALAYFSIPLELIYFVNKSSFFPYRWVLIQFGAFIVLCGATHLINLWTFTMHTRTVAIVMTVAKVATAVVSCATALMLVHIIPDLLSVKTRELFLKKKADDLDREMGLIRTQEETGRHVRMLTHEIRSTLDRHTILKTTLVELGRTLGLEECALWMPSRSGSSLQLSHTLRHQIPVGSSVQINLPVVNQVFSSNRAIIVPHTSPLARIRPVQGRYVPPEVAAVRVPLLHLSNFQINDWPELSAKSYAIMVLMLPSDSARKWHVHELELVEVVADQLMPPGMRRVAPATGGPAAPEAGHVHKDRDVYARHFLGGAYDSDHGALRSTRPGRIRTPPGTRHADIACRDRSSPAEGSRASPRIRIWEPDGYDVVEGEAEAPLDIRQRRRPGKTVREGHKSYHLMLNLQLGIRHAVGKSAAKPMRELKRADFDPAEKFWTRFPPAGSKLTPPHPSPKFRWKDYCPMVFRHMRELFDVDPADYMLAICGDDALRELSSPGKSGSVFYLTQDERFMIKTVKKSEVKLLIRMLPSYYKHVRRYKSSLITRFYGVHSVKPNGGQKVRFIVMGNLFCSEDRIHRRYDLKGSSYGRMSDKLEQEIGEATTLKDLDLDFAFRMQRPRHKQLHEQLRRDCEFLESEGIMDYSLLVGVHFRDDTAASNIDLSTFPTPAELSANKVSACQGSVSMAEPCLSAKGLDKTPDSRKPLARLGARLPARAERTSRSKTDSFVSGGGGSKIREEAYDVVLYFGIIDILRDYDISKKLEHAYKSLQTDPGSISAVDPKLYSQRFRDFMSRVFVKEG